MEADFVYESQILFGLIPIQMPVTLKLKDVSVYGQVGETVLKYGLPEFNTPDFHFSIGHTSIKLHKNRKILEFFLNQLLGILNTVTTFATEWFAEGLVQLYLDHTVENLTNYYNYPFDWWHMGRPSKFYLDLRQTMQPEWGRNYLNLYFLGDLTYEASRKHFPFPPKADPIEFNSRKSAAQIVLSEHVLESFMHGLDQAGMLMLDSEMPEMKAILNLREGERLTTTAMQTDFPIFYEKYGHRAMKLDCYSDGDTQITISEKDGISATFPMNISFLVGLSEDVETENFLEAF